MVAVVAGMVAVVAKMLVKKVMVAGIVVLVRHFNAKQNKHCAALPEAKPARRAAMCIQEGATQIPKVQYL
jgi:hypothetical protein